MKSETGGADTSRDRDRALHARLLQHDPTAPSDLAERYLPSLVDALQSTFPDIDDALLEDVAIELILAFAQRPEHYDPGRAGLASYLRMAARRDVQNAIQSQRRRDHHHVPLEDVELHPLARNILWASNRDPADTLADRLDDERVARLREQFQGTEREVVDLMIEGERRTEAYAPMLGLQDRSRIEQAREVKRVKDRLKKRMQRLWRGMTDDG